MVFLIDYVLKGKTMPNFVERFVSGLPGSETKSLWSAGQLLVRQSSFC
jgi:hypothetical protein